MADVIRDVLVRVALQQVDEKLKGIDTSAVKADVEKARNDVRTASESARQELQKVQEATGRTAASFTRMGSDGASALDEAADASRRLRDEQERLGRDSQTAARDVVDSNIRAADSFKQAGEGAFTLARGLAFVSASTEEDFQQALQTIARFQGAFDIFRGTTDTIRGMVEGMRALRTASSATAAANAGLAASNTAVATTSTAAATGMRGLMAAMGPAGIALAAAGAAALALAAAFRETNEAADDSETGTVGRLRAIERQAGTTQSAVEQLAASLLTVEQGGASGGRSGGGAFGLLGSTGLPVGFDRTRFGGVGVGHQVAAAGGGLPDLTADIRRAADLQEGSRELANAIRTAEQSARLGSAALPFLDAAARLDALEAAQRGRLGRLPQFGPGGGPGLSRVTAAGASGLVRSAFDESGQDIGGRGALVGIAAAQLDQLLEGEREILSLRRSVTAERERELRSMQTAADLAREQMQAERARLATLDEIVGRLDAGQFAELRSLAERVGAGETLSAVELRRLEELGGAGTRGFVGERFAELGRGRGGADVFDAFSSTTAESSRERIASLAAEAAGIEREVAMSLEELQRESVEADRRQIELIRQLISDQQRLIRDVHDLDAFRSRAVAGALSDR